MEKVEEPKKKTYTAAQKKATYKWREKHHDTYVVYASALTKLSYHKHAEKRKLYNKNKYYYDKEALRLRLICISDYITVV